MAYISILIGTQIATVDCIDYHVVLEHASRLLDTLRPRTVIIHGNVI